MVLQGRVENGVVGLQEGANLPEGTRVSVIVRQAPAESTDERRVELPLVSLEQPGTLRLTAERVAVFLGDGDVPA